MDGTNRSRDKSREDVGAGTLTKRQAAIVTAYTGMFLGDFHTFHAYVEELMERPVYTHEMGSLDLAAEVKRRAKADYVSLSPRD